MRKVISTIIVAIAALAALPSCRKEGRQDPVCGLWESSDVEVEATVFGKPYVINTYRDLYEAIFDIAGPYMSDEEKEDFRKLIEESDNGREPLLNTGEEALRLEFQPSGKAVAYYLEDDGIWSSGAEGEYVHTEDRLTVYLKDEDGLSELPFRIKSLKRKTMVLETDLSDLGTKAPAASFITASMDITFKKIKG